MAASADGGPDSLYGGQARNTTHSTGTFDAIAHATVIHSLAACPWTGQRQEQRATVATGSP